ncbi:MAG: hypothetical protein Q8K58_07700 [Acidimicrobiales bacterium]|nr:hypothetical protein [Acidimicrobiales bacterium]
MQTGIMGDDGALQLQQRRGRVEAQLLAQLCSEVLGGPQPSGWRPAEQGAHQQLPEALPHDVLVDQALELGQHLTVATAGQVGGDASSMAVTRPRRGDRRRRRGTDPASPALRSASSRGVAQW